MQLHELLKSYRERYGYTQEELANQLYISRQAVSKWERGEATPDIDNLIRLSDIYDISIDELIRGSRFFPKPFTVGEHALRLKIIGVTLLSFILSLIVSGGNLIIFSIVFLILEFPFVFLLKEGKWVITRKGIEVTHYRNYKERLISMFQKNKYVELYSYDRVTSFEIVYKALKRFGPFDFKPDYFYVKLTIDDQVYKIEIWNQLLEDLPLLVDYLKRQGVCVVDNKNIIEMIVKDIPIYETLHV